MLMLPVNDRIKGQFHPALLEHDPVHNDIRGNVPQFRIARSTARIVQQRSMKQFVQNHASNLVVRKTMEALASAPPKDTDPAWPAFMIEIEAVAVLP